MHYKMIQITLRNFHSSSAPGLILVGLHVSQNSLSSSLLCLFTKQSISCEDMKFIHIVWTLRDVQLVYISLRCMLDVQHIQYISYTCVLDLQLQQEVFKFQASQKRCAYLNQQSQFFSTGNCVQQPFSTFIQLMPKKIS